MASLLSFSLLLPSIVHAESAPKEKEGKLTLQSESALLINADTNEILFEKNADEQLPPASLTKIMTMYIASDAMKKGKLKEKDPVAISEKAWQTGGSRMFLEVGTEQPAIEIFKGIAVVSGNDASVAMAEHLSGSTDKFVEKMNKTAADLGMKQTKFKTVNGLSSAADGDTTTARDLMTLSRTYINAFPKNMKIHAMKSYTTETRTHPIEQPNHNPLLGEYEGADGLKTGFIDQHYNLVSTVKRGNLRLIAVVLKAPSDSTRKADTIKLLDYGFAQYDKVDVGKKNDVMQTLKVYQAKKSEITETPILLAKDATFMAKKSDIETMEITYDLPKYIKAGVSKGDKVGTIRVKLGKDTYQEDLIVDQTIEKAGIVKSFIDWVVIKLNDVMDLVFG